MSVATGGAVIGTAALASASVSAAGPVAAPVSAASSTLPAESLDASASVAAPQASASVAAGAARVTIIVPRATPVSGSANPQPTSANPQPTTDGLVHPSLSDRLQDGSGSGRPFDPSAATAGFAGPYRFVAHLSGLPGLTNLGGVVQGVVRDSTHFVLDFPESTFITRYTRDGATARVVVNGKTVIARPGLATAGAISPEDMLPGGMWAQIIASWAGTLQPTRTPGSYASNSSRLKDLARLQGIRATDWQLTAKTNATGRLTTLAFSGLSWGHAFALDLVILYG